MIGGHNNKGDRFRSSSMHSEEPQEPTETDPHQTRRSVRWSFFIWPVILVVLLFAGWLNYPDLMQMIAPALTATPQPTVTPTIRPTRTPTTVPTATIIPTPTNTPLPLSAYALSNGWQLSPPIRGVESGVIVLDEATSATVEPGFDTPFWISSDQIARESGFNIIEPYYATFGYGSITWETDVIIAPGMYEIYVMDTLYSSAGPLDFQVHVGNTEIFPIIGSQHVEFQSVRGEPPQRTDKWRSLGIYESDQLDKLAVSTTWERRNESTLVAIDRVVIVPLPGSTRDLLSVFPSDREVVVIDNLASDIEAGQVLYTEEGELAWGDQYQFVINPGSDVRILWTAPEYMPPGQYQAAAWIPPAHARMEVSFTFLVNDTPIANDAGEQVRTIVQSEYKGGQWIDLGTWTTPRIYEKPVQLALRMEIKGGSVGEAAFDAIAFIRWEEKAQESP
jgi:hypothetical protein